MEKRDGIVLFANDKRQNESQPVMRGVLTLDGTEYEVALWGKTSAKGLKFWSGAIKPKEERQAKAPVKDTAPDFDDDVPF